MLTDNKYIIYKNKNILRKILQYYKLWGYAKSFALYPKDSLKPKFSKKGNPVSLYVKAFLIFKGKKISKRPKVTTSLYFA